jgi:DNA-directed RNA polymerase II subunit RPB4
MAAPAPTSRKREPIQGDEEAGAELKLGEFQDVDALTHSEAALVINALVAKRKSERKNVNDTEYVAFVEYILWEFGLEGRAEEILNDVNMD